MSLIEVMASMLLVVTVGVGVAGVIQDEQTMSELDRSRSIAAALAQRDQDRMHALRPGDLPFGERRRTETEGDVDFTVASLAQLVTDSSGRADACDERPGRGHVKLTSMVTWPNMAIPLVTAESFAAMTGRNGRVDSDADFQDSRARSNVCSLVSRVEACADESGGDYSGCDRLAGGRAMVTSVTATDYVVSDASASNNVFSFRKRGTPQRVCTETNTGGSCNEGIW